MLSIALVPWLSEFITSFKIGAGGVEITTRLDNVEKKADAAFDASVHGVAKNPRQAAKRKTTPPSEGIRESIRNEEPAPDSDDPNKGRFGGKSKSNFRKLTARVEHIPNEEFYRRIVLRVTSTDKQKPLKGSVVFHLHPTFEPKSFEEKVSDDGVAETTLVSYGAFTVGAEADNGATRLEYDLTALDDDDPFFDR